MIQIDARRVAVTTPLRLLFEICPTCFAPIPAEHIDGHLQWHESLFVHAPELPPPEET